MIVYLSRDIRPFVMYCVSEKPRSSLLIESTDSLITVCAITVESTAFPISISPPQVVHVKSIHRYITEHIINDHLDHFAIVTGDFDAHTRPNGAWL